MDFATGQEKTPKKHQMESQKENEPSSSRKRNALRSEACYMSAAGHYVQLMLVFK